MGDKDDQNQAPKQSQTPEQTAPAVLAKPGTNVINTGLTEKRRAMLELVAKWMPTSLNKPLVPPGETQDLLSLSGWTKAKGEASKKVSDDNKKNGTKDPVVTSCGDVLKTLLILWKSEFVGAFNIRDTDHRNRKPGAKDLKYYVEADGTNVPERGDIIVLRNGIGKSSAGSVSHVGILVEMSGSVWRTADGGGGTLPDQTAEITNRKVEFTDDDKKIPILTSPTDKKRKQLDGWVVLERVPRKA